MKSETLGFTFYSFIRDDVREVGGSLPLSRAAIGGQLEEKARRPVTITIDIKPEVQAELARQATACGRAFEAHAASLLEEAAHVPSIANHPVFDKERARRAGERIRELRKGVTLGGLTIRELIDEGRP